MFRSFDDERDRWRTRLMSMWKNNFIVCYVFGSGSVFVVMRGWRPHNDLPSLRQEHSCIWHGGGV